MSYIKTERFILDPNHGSGTKIVVPELQRKRKPIKYQNKPKSPYKSIIKEKSKRVKSKKENKPKRVNKYIPDKWDGKVPEHIKKKSWLIRDPLFIRDNYVYFEPL